MTRLFFSAGVARIVVLQLNTIITLKHEETLTVINEPPKSDPIEA